MRFQEHIRKTAIGQTLKFYTGPWFNVGDVDAEEKAHFDDDTKTMAMVATEESPDRSVGDVVVVSGLDTKDFDRNPVFLRMHSYDDWAIGRCSKLEKSDGRARSTVTWALPPHVPEECVSNDTRIGWGVYKGGFQKGVSIGFVDVNSELIRAEEGSRFTDARRFRKSSLLEISAVPVPAHARALVGKDAEHAMRSVLEEVVGHNGGRALGADRIGAIVKRFSELLLLALSEPADADPASTAPGSDESTPHFAEPVSTGPVKKTVDELAAIVASDLRSKYAF